MDIRYGAVREEDITFSATGHKHTGGTDGNTLGLDALKVDEQSAENAGVVTILVSATNIAVLPSMNVLAGDRILVTAFVYATKGATAGRTSLFIGKDSGTATILVGNDYTGMDDTMDIGANVALERVVSGVLKVSVGGTLVLRVGGLSLGSDSTVAANNGQLHALVLRGIG